MASLVLLWVVILVEGVLLYLLYRHVGLKLAARVLEEAGGLPQGSDAPEFTAQDRAAGDLSLQTLLREDWQLFIFASLDCSPCHSLLESQELGEFLTVRQIPAYVLVESSDLARSPSFAESTDDRGITTLGVKKDVFDDYRVDSTPFAYFIGRSGRVDAAGAVTGVQHLIDLLTLARLQREALEKSQEGRSLLREQSPQGQH